MSDGPHLCGTTNSLRDEVIASQVARNGYLKWKIVLIAALGAVGLGIYRNTGHTFPAILGFIPLVCAYVDALCIHNDIRMLIIAKYLRNGIKGWSGLADTGREAELKIDPPDPHMTAYEELCAGSRFIFSIESAALLWTSVIASVLVFSVAQFNVWGAITCTEDTIGHGLKLWLKIASVMGGLACMLMYICKKLLLRYYLDRRWTSS